MWLLCVDEGSSAAPMLPSPVGLVLGVMAGLIGALRILVNAIITQLKVLYHMLLSPVRGETHQDRLESFYKHQATGYDAFRKKLLHGRDYIATDTPKFNKSIWIDMGGGTGASGCSASVFRLLSAVSTV